MNTLIIVADLGQLKVYRVTRDELSDTSPSITLETEKDLPGLHSHFAERDTDDAGRFAQGARRRFPQGASSQSTPSGMSYGEKHNEETEAERVQLLRVSEEIEGEVTSAAIDFFLAAPQTIHDRLLDLLSPAAKQHLKKSLPLDLVKAPKLDLLRRFGLAD